MLSLETKDMNDKLKHFIAVIIISISCAASAQSFEPIPFDKKWHMAAGTFAGTWGTFAGNSLELSDEGAALFGIGASVVAGVGKELMDVAPVVFGNKSARFDVMDIAATVEGGIIGAGLSYAALKIFKKKPIFYGKVDKGIVIGFRHQF